jgi:hypothetical protein
MSTTVQFSPVNGTAEHIRTQLTQWKLERLNSDKAHGFSEFVQKRHDFAFDIILSEFNAKVALLSGEENTTWIVNKVVQCNSDDSYDTNGPINCYRTDVNAWYIDYPGTKEPVEVIEEEPPIE